MLVPAGTPEFSSGDKDLPQECPGLGARSSSDQQSAADIQGSPDVNTRVENTLQA